MEDIPRASLSGWATLDDQALLAQCASGEELAWREFVRRYSNLIYYVIKVRCGHKGEDADEIYQSTFLKILKNLDSLREKEKLRSWLLTITWNECIDYTRKKQVSRRFFSDMEELPEKGSREQEYYVGLYEMLGHLKRAFTSLSPKNRELLAEKYKGSTVDEISEKLDIPKGSINYNHKKACKELSSILSRLNYRYEDFSEAFDGFLLPLEK